MYKFIKSTLVLLLFITASAFGPNAQATSAVQPVQSDKCMDVVDITLWQVAPGQLLASWTTVPPGNSSFVVLFDVTTQQPVQQFNTLLNGAVFNNLVSGHTYLVSVSHGQNVKSKAIVVF